MSFLWKLLRIFRICKCMRPCKSPLHFDFRYAVHIQIQRHQKKKQEKPLGRVVGCGL